MQGSLQRWRQEGARFEHRGHAIFYRISGAVGAGPALLCIHGFPTASWDWHALWEPLTQRFGCVVAPDMIGFGFSAKPRGYAYSLLDQADLHEALLSQLGIERVHLLSHDYGDTVAQELLARHAERSGSGLQLASATLLNGGLFPETHRATFVQRLIAGPLGPWLSRWMGERAFGRSLSAVFGPHTKPTPEQLSAFWQLMSEGGGTAIAHDLLRYLRERVEHRSRWVGALQTTRVPLRLIDGPVDPVSGLRMVERYRELVPSPDVVLLDGIGHYPQVEAPEQVTSAFLAFHERLGTFAPR